MIKRILFLLTIGIVIVSCNQKIVRKTFVYKRFKNETLSGYTMRKYTFTYDTIIVKTIYYDLSGKILDDKQINRYVVTKHGLDIIIKERKLIKTFPYLIISDTDSCYASSDFLLNKIKSCYKGKIGYMDYNDLYKITYTQDVIDGIAMNIYLDKDYILVAKDSILFAPFNKEIRVNSKEKIKLMKLLKY